MSQTDIPTVAADVSGEPAEPVGVPQPERVTLALKVSGVELERQFTADEIVAAVQMSLDIQEKYRKVASWRREMEPFRRIVGSVEFREFLEALQRRDSPLVPDVAPPEPLETEPGDPKEVSIPDDAPEQQREKLLRLQMSRGDVGAAAELALVLLRRKPRFLTEEVIADAG